jgi:hypothetical protein
MQYRIWFYRGHLGPQPHFAALHSFHADSAQDAAEIAFDLYSLCSDAVTSYELWCNTECLVQALDRPTPGYPKIQRRTELRQAQMVEHEEMLQASYACIRQSRKLMETIKFLTDKRN